MENFNEEQKRKAKQAGEIVSHDDLAQPGDNEKGQRMSNLPYRSGDFPAVKTDQGSANGYPQPVEQSPLESSLPMTQTPAESAAIGNEFWARPDGQGARK